VSQFDNAFPLKLLQDFIVYQIKTWRFSWNNVALYFGDYFFWHHQWTILIFLRQDHLLLIPALLPVGLENLFQVVCK
jgi:hypothetical protein